MSTTMALQFALNRLFVVTANLGSVFEEESIEDNWLAEFEKVVVQADPDLVALHCQEIGGKDFETDMPKVRNFLARLRGLKCFTHFDRVRGWFDTDFKNHNAFTALGNLYMFHKRVEPVFSWNFHTKEFSEVLGDELIIEDLSLNQFHVKERFPNDFYPGVRWSRKGYLLTRWKMFGSHIMNFANIHLFHDDDNVVALEKSPSIYAGCRRRALDFALERITAALEAPEEPLYIYGDFNFRLDISAVVKHLLAKTNQSEVVREANRVANRVTFKLSQDSLEPVVVVEGKRFWTNDGAQFTEQHKELLMYDHEPRLFKNLKELAIDFQPSYPFSETEGEGDKYLDKRCPGWCDRILMTEAGHKQVVDSPLGCMYNMMAKGICVGDHKPIYLFFTVASTTPMRQLPDDNLDA